MDRTAAIRIDAQDCAPARWDDPARGTLSWRTLIPGAVTATRPLTWFTPFARDRFDQIAYPFTHEDPAQGQRPE